MVLLRGLRVRMGVASGISQGRKVRSFLPDLHLHDITLLVSMADRASRWHHEHVYITMLQMLTPTTSKPLQQCVNVSLTNFGQWKTTKWCILVMISQLANTSCKSDLQQTGSLTSPYRTSNSVIQHSVLHHAHTARIGMG